ncbi:MAG: fatty acid desaturase [Gammaproteobacteria bacterium]|nr:fatty acid desaturase [Gammaproteobacteria bacterium]
MNTNNNTNNAHELMAPPIPPVQGLWQHWQLPTWLIVVFVYSSYYLLMSNANQLTWWQLALLAGPLLCLHGSLQHEILHGHPTPWPWFNDLLGWAPLSLWIPYSRYRDSHRLHHQVDTLAEPGIDPESYYHLPQQWLSKTRLGRCLWHINFTLAGRLIIGPWLVLWAFISTEGTQLLKGDIYSWQSWLPHFALSAGLLIWLQEQGIAWWYYVLVCVWPGLSLTLMRSYLEHRPESDNHRRTALVEGNWFTNTLYMAVNIHQVHHEHASLAWFMVKPYYLANKDYVLAKNGGYYYRGYGQIMQQFLVKQKDSPIYKP